MPNHATQTFEGLLFQVAEKTFGELAFLLVEQEEITQSRHRQPPRWGYAARVEFSGPFNGEMHLAITETMLRPLAANMLGIDEYENLPEGVKLEDALKELLNVTCGNLLPLLGGDQVVFHISAPYLLPPPLPPTPDALVPAGHVQMAMDVGTAYLALFIDPNANGEQMLRELSSPKGDAL